jgi:hypothetical protein
MARKLVFLITLSVLFGFARSEVLTFNMSDYTISPDWRTINYKEKTYKTSNLAGVVTQVVLKEVDFNGQYAEGFIVNSYESILLNPNMELELYDTTVDSVGQNRPYYPITIAARGIKRHTGFSILELNPFYVHNDSLFFVTSVNFDYTDYRTYEPLFFKADKMEKIDLVIITSEKFTNIFETYRSYKIKMGLKTIIKTVEEIYSEYPGENNVMKIRNYIKSKYVQNDVEFVIIGGGYDIVPVGEALPYVSSETGYVHTDIFYSHLNGDLDNNKNGIYCEFEDDPDYYADVYVGRFPGNTETELNSIINKNINYYSPARNFRNGFNSSIFFAGFTVERVGDGRKLCNNIKTELPVTFTVDSMYEGFTPDFNYQNIMSRFNSGFNFVYAQAHGDLHVLRQADYQFKIWSDQILATNAVSGLYFIGSCEPGSIGKDSFSRKAMVSEIGGCVNYIGMSGEEWPGSSNNMNAYFFDGLFRNRSYGQSFAEAAIMFGDIKWEDIGRYLNFGYAFQGDPSNKPYLKEPNTINLNSIGQIKRGNGTVSGAFSAVPNDTIFITLTANNEVISRTKTINSNFNLVYDNLTSDSVFISYHSQELFLKTTGYKTVSSTDIEFKISDIVLNDGNKSAVIEHGENFGLIFKFSLNSNPLAIDSLVAKISGIDHTGINVLNGTKRFKLPVTGSYFNVASFLLHFSSSDSIVTDSVAVANFEIQKKDGTKLFEEKIYIPVAVPYLKLQSVIRTGNIIKPRFLNTSKGFINLAKIELFEVVKTSLPVRDKIIIRKSFIELEDITGYKIVSDSLNFTIDSTKTYVFKTTINGDKYYYSEKLFFKNNLIQPLTVYADHSPGRINLEWFHSYEGDISYNIYSSETENFISKIQRNFEKIHLQNFSFNYEQTSPIYLKVALVDSTGCEFVMSDPVRIMPLALYKDTTYKLAPFQLYNPVYIDGKMISNSQNSSIAGLNKNGVPVNGNGLIHEADLNGFSASSLQGGFAIGDIDGNGLNDMVNYSYSMGDSILVKVVDLASGNIIAQRNIYGFVQENAPVLVNADADGQLEIFLSVLNGYSGGVGTSVYMLDLNGSSLEISSGFPITSIFSSWTIHSPSILDLNGDGIRELIFNSGSRIVLYNANTLTKIKDFAAPSTIQTSLSYCDINLDGNIEIFALTESYGSYGKLMCYNFNGTTLIPSPLCLSGINVDMKPYSYNDLTPPVSLADIDDNGSIEIIVLTASKLYVFNNNFTIYTNFPVSIDPRATKNNSSPPAIADLDGDGYMDILFYDANFRMWAYSGDSGEILEGFPIQIPYLDRWELTSPAVADLDIDGDLEFAVGVRDGILLVYDYPVQSSGRPIFDKYRGDTYNSGLFQPLIPSSPTDIAISSSGSDVTISWSPVNGAIKYKVYSSANPYGAFVYEGETTGTSYIIYNASDSKKFYYITTVR